jgi:seryl-tRNA synthetase
MIDHRIIRDNPELIRDALRKRHSDFDLDALIQAEARRRELLAVENLRAEKNQLSDQIGEAYKPPSLNSPRKSKTRRRNSKQSRNSSTH